jgi:YggT family protein
MIALIQFVHLGFQVYSVLLLIRILSSWFPQASQYRFIQFIYYYTDPYLNIFRKFIPPLGMIDLSPIVAFLCLRFLESIIIQLLISLV